MTRLAAIIATTIAAIALAACSSTPQATAAHPGAGPSLAAQLAAPATCDHLRIARWGVATCRAWDRLSPAAKRVVGDRPFAGQVDESVTFPTPGTALVKTCSRVVPTSTGNYRASYPGTEWMALVATGPVKGSEPASVTEGTFSCANV